MAEVTDLGGKSKANVHLEIEGRGTVVAESLRQYLSDLTENLLYKKVLAHVAYRKNLQTGEWDKPRLIAIENPVRHQFDEQAFEQAIARPNGWEDVADPIAEIRKLRGEDGFGSCVGGRIASAKSEAVVLAMGGTIIGEVNVGRSVVTVYALASLCTPNHRV